MFALTIIVSMLGMIYLWNNCRLDISVFRNWFLERKAFMLQKESFMPYIFMTIVFFLQLILALIYNYQNKAEPVADVFLTEELQIQESKQVIENRNENTCTEEPEEKEIANSDKEQEEKPKVKLLDNPLPVPKKHVKKEMNYAFEPSEDQMHYDLNNYRVDDDYDLKTGL